MKRITQIKRTVRKTVRTIPGDVLSGGRPRRVVITRTTTSRRQTLR